MVLLFIVIDLVCFLRWKGLEYFETGRKKPIERRYRRRTERAKSQKRRG